MFLHIPKTGGTTIEKVIFPDHSFGTEADYSALYGWDVTLGWLNHLTLDQITGLNPCLDLREYFVFTVVRNPWDRLVSEYHWKNSISDLEISLRDFVRLLYSRETKPIQHYYKSKIAFEQHFRPQTGYLPKSDSQLVKILRFEDFATQVSSVLRERFSLTGELPRCRSSIHKHYTHYYDRRTIDMVREIYSTDIDRLDYKYG